MHIDQIQGGKSRAKTHLRCRMTESCFKKCVNKNFREGELDLGEASCVDRCTHKYWQATAIVGQLLGMNAQQNQSQ